MSYYPPQSRGGYGGGTLAEQHHNRRAAQAEQHRGGRGFRLGRVAAVGVSRLRSDPTGDEYDQNDFNDGDDDDGGGDYQGGYYEDRRGRSNTQQRHPRRYVADDDAGYDNAVGGSRPTFRREVAEYRESRPDYYGDTDVYVEGGRGEDDDDEEPLPNAAELYGGTFQEIRDTLSSLGTAIRGKHNTRPQNQRSFPASGTSTTRAGRRQYEVEDAGDSGGRPEGPHWYEADVAEDAEETRLAPPPSQQQQQQLPPSSRVNSRGSRPRSSGSSTQRPTSASSSARGGRVDAAAPPVAKTKAGGAPAAAPDFQVSATTSKWTDLARQGNSEVNRQRIAKLESGEPMTDDDNDEAGTAAATTDAAAGVTKSKKKSDDAAAAAEERRRQSFEEAELRAVSELQVKLHTIEATHKEEIAKMRLKHQEDLAAAKLAILTEVQNEAKENISRIERKSSADRAKWQDDKLLLKANSDELTGELSKQRNSVAELQASYTTLQNRHENIKAELQKRTSGMEALRSETQATQQELDRLCKAHEQLKSSANRSEVTSRKEIDQLKAELKVARDDATHYRHESATLVKEKTVLESEFSRLEDRMNKKYVKLEAGVEEGVKKWQQGKQKSDKRREELEVELEEMSKALQKREADLEHLNVAYRDALKELEDALTESDQDMAVLKEKLSSAEARSEDRHELLQAAQAELKEYHVKVETLLEEKNVFTQQISELSDELNHAKNTVEALMDEKAERDNVVNETFAVMKKEASVKDKQLAQLAGCRDSTQQLAKVRAELAQWKDKYEVAKEELDDLTSSKKSRQRKPAVPASKQQPQRRPTNSSTIPGSVPKAPAPPRGVYDDADQEAADAAALEDADLRALELRKREIQRDMAADRCRMEEGESERLVQRVRDRLRKLRMYDSSSSSSASGKGGAP